jgi:SAM-dependent methyltransferase
MTNADSEMLSMKDKRYSADIDRLRSPDRMKLLEVGRVVDAILDAFPSSSVLDAGTGSGLFAEEFVSRGMRVTEIDVKPEMAAGARAFVPQGMFETVTIEAPPFPLVNNNSRGSFNEMGLELSSPLRSGDHGSNLAVFPGVVHVEEFHPLCALKSSVEIDNFGIQSIQQAED